MPETIRSHDELLAHFPDDAGPKSIVPERVRDFVVTHDARLRALESMGHPTTPTGTYMRSGGQVSWTGTGLDFRVSAGSGFIVGVPFTSTEQVVTLGAADATFPRLDTIAMGVDGVAVVIEGTPSANPVRPDVDPFDQIALSFILVPAGSATPNVSRTVIYAEGAGLGGGEWTASDNSATITPAAATSPFAGAAHVAFVASGNGNRLTLAPAAPISVANASQLTMHVEPVAWANKRALQCWFVNSSGQRIGNTVTVADGAFGFSRTLLDYQQVAIPMTTFAVPAGAAVAGLVLEVMGSGSTLSANVDNVALEVGGEPSPSDGLLALLAAKLDKAGPFAAVYHFGDGTAAGESEEGASLVYRFPARVKIIGWVLETNEAVTATLGVASAPAGSQVYTSMVGGGTAPALAASSFASDTDGAVDWATTEIPQYGSLRVSLAAFAGAGQTRVSFTLLYTRL